MTLGLPTIEKFVRKHNLIILVIFLSAIFLLTLRGLHGNLLPNARENRIIGNVPPFETSLERGRYAQVIELAENKSLTADDYVDFLMPDIAWYNGHYLAVFPPGPAILAVPLFILGQQFELSQVSTYLLSLIFGILTCIVIYKICEELKLSIKTRLISVFCYGFASVAWAYTVTLSAHTISAFLISTAFLIMLNIKKGKSNFLNLSLLWSVFGINLFVDYPNLVIILPILIGGIIRTFQVQRQDGEVGLIIPMSILYSAIFLAIIMTGFIFYNKNVYGIPIAFSNRYNLKVLENAGIKINKKYLNNNIFSLHKYSNRFSLKQLMRGVNILTVSTDRGLFVYSPIFIFSFFGIVKSILKKNLWAIVITLTFFADILVYGSFDDPWGGWGFGPRYLIPSLPLLAVSAGYLLNDSFFKSLFNKLLFSALYFYSCSIALIGALTTNAVPPKIEATGTHSNFLFNAEYLLSKGTSSFLFNYSFIKNLISPSVFYLILLFFIVFFCLSLVWVYDDKN